MSSQADAVTAAATINVTVDVGELTLATVVGEHREFVAYEGDEYDGKGGYWDTRPATLLDLVVDRLVERFADTNLRVAIEKIRDQVVREQVEKTVREVMLEPFQPTTRYGEKQGEPQTLRGVIAEQAEKALTMRVTRDGRMFNTNPETMAEAIVREAVDAAFIKELKAAVEKEKARVVQAMSAEGARVIASMLAAAVK